MLTGRAAAEFAGPGIMISFVITGTLCAFVALGYAELAAAIPVSGSAYSYSYASMGEFVAWIMGLLLLLEYGLAASTVAVGWSGYVVSLLHDLGYQHTGRTHGRAGIVVKDAAPARRSLRRVNLPALIGILAVTLAARARRFGIGDGQQRRRRHQGDGGHRLHRHRRRST